ncbi:helix-turn-helix transcriptional regulator [Streptomyces hygroscopicus]|uniref:helix-turn-helix transcriptional regulator n=1 Tax=Streptomyces hygroscopicus TaxID=1912 RepID=UPI0036C6A7F0
MPSAPPPDDWVLTRRRAVGNRIRELRLWRNLSQERLAERCGVDRQTVNRIEMGHQAATIDTLIRIAQALAVPLTDLVRGLGSPLPPEE